MKTPLTEAQKKIVDKFFPYMVRCVNKYVFDYIKRPNAHSEVFDHALDRLVDAVQKFDPTTHGGIPIKAWIAYNIRRGMYSGHKEWMYRFEQENGAVQSLGTGGDKARVLRTRREWSPHKIMEYTEGMSTKYADPIRMRFVEGYSFEEIAVAMHVSPSHARNLLGRGLEILRNRESI